ncbi:MAG: ABC transporter ATP-binding protein [Pirellulaceae bacterium]|nr:ABC transporter ATP-binding protein [Pirellulaceae bacterium]
MPIIETCHLGRYYGRRRGIEDVSLKIDEGQIFGFLGPNGAGKSTTLRILLGFLRPDTGTARIQGHDCWRSSPQIKHDVGYVPGDVRLYPWFTARRGLKIVGRIRQREVMQRGLELCDVFALEPDLPVRKMSRGNRQKLSLILALAHRPRVVVLDEPTSGLDPLMQANLMQQLRSCVNDGATVLFSSHTLSEVEEMCHRVAMIRQGRIVVDEPLASLKQRAPRSVQIVLAAGSSANISWPQGLDVRSIAEGTVQAQWLGPSPEFFKWAASQPFVDLSISPPSLEALFHSYYETPRE